MMTLDVVNLLTMAPIDDILIFVRDFAADPLLEECTYIPTDNLMEMLTFCVETINFGLKILGQCPLLGDVDPPLLFFISPLFSSFFLSTSILIVFPNICSFLFLPKPKFVPYWAVLFLLLFWFFLFIVINKTYFSVRNSISISTYKVFIK